MHPLLDARIGATCDAQQLDAEAQLVGIVEIDRRDLPDAFDVDGGEIDRRAEGDGGQDRQLVRGIDAVDVEAGIGLGIAQSLGIGQHVGEVAAGGPHLRQDVVAGAVENAVDLRHGIAGQTFAQPLDDRDAAGHRRLEGDGQAARFGLPGDLGAMDGQQRLVGGDDVLTGLQRGGDGVARRAFRAADQFHHQIGAGLRRHGDGIVEPLHARQVDAAVLALGPRADRDHLDPAAAALFDQRALRLQQLQDTGADRTEAGDGDFQGGLLGVRHQAFAFSDSRRAARAAGSLLAATPPALERKNSLMLRVA